MKEDFQLYQVNLDHMTSVMSPRSRDPGTEAHGGYTFCGFAGLVLLGKPNLCDVNKLLVSKFDYTNSKLIIIILIHKYNIQSENLLCLFD